MGGRALVTGATGFVGATLVRRLCRERPLGLTHVRALVRPTSPGAWLIEDLEDLERSTGDLRDPLSLARALEGCDLLFHAAAHLRVGVSRVQHHRAVNVEGTRTLLALAREARVRRVVVVSSVAAAALGSPDRPATEEDPWDLGGFRLPYIDTKRAQEEVALAACGPDLEVVVVNPGFIFGPGDVGPMAGLLLLAFDRGLLPFVTPGWLPAVDVRDVVEGMLQAAARGLPGRRYFLCERSLSYLELGRLVARQRGGRPPRGVLPRPLAVAGGLAGDLLGHGSSFEVPLSTSVARYGSAAHCVSGARATRELGVQYRPLPETIDAALAWFDRHGYTDRPLLATLWRTMRPRS
jgi:dihydroflavonol-4-reductase